MATVKVFVRYRVNGLRKLHPLSLLRRCVWLRRLPVVCFGSGGMRRGSRFGNERGLTPIRLSCSESGSLMLSIRL